LLFHLPSACPKSSVGQETANHFGAKVQTGDHREYGEATITILKQKGKTPNGEHLDALFEGIDDTMPVRFAFYPSTPY
jgi:hypothetical protein